MSQTNEKKGSTPKNIIAYHSMNGAAIITEKGNEIPITPAMIEHALRALEQKTDYLH